MEGGLVYPISTEVGFHGDWPHSDSFAGRTVDTAIGKLLGVQVTELETHTDITFSSAICQGQFREV